MTKAKLVWSDELGDLRKQVSKQDESNAIDPVDVKLLVLKLRRLTQGKGRAVIEISSLPENSSWCKELERELKKTLGVGGTYKKNIIEISGDKMLEVANLLDQKQIKWKKIGG